MNPPADASLTQRLASRSARLRGDAPLVALDAVTVAVSLAAVTVLNDEGAVSTEQWQELLAFLPLAALVVIGIGAAQGLYGSIWQHAGIQEARQLVVSGTITLLLLSAVTAVNDGGIPASVVVLATVLSTGMQGLLRFQSRLFAYRRRQAGGATGARVLVLGAGQAGAALVQDMLTHPHAGLVPVGVLDDDPRKLGRRVHGVQVLGPLWQVSQLALEHDAQQVVLAITAAPQEAVALLSEQCSRAGIALRLLPTPAELVGGKVTLQDVRDLRIDDLLGRSQVSTDLAAVSRLLSGKRVLITGAGGSIGSEIARQVGACNPATLVLLDHDETHLHDTAATVSGSPVQVLCDIRQRGLVHRVFAVHRPQVVFHAAAHKHVPLLEDHPCEAVKTNVHGTRNVVAAAAMVGTERLVFISTDKAVRPSSVMGATKAVGEQIALSASTARSPFCAVRFGNVLGSRGSVIPTFVRQIQSGGPVTLTDARMTRFFMSIPEAVQLVLQSAAMSTGGEVFMLEMGEPVKIIDLAQRMIALSGRRVGTDVEIRVTGIRPGEKLVEELCTPEEHSSWTAHPSIVRLVPRALHEDVLTHELDELVEAADNGRQDVVRSSLFAMASLAARRSSRSHGLTAGRRLIDLRGDDRDEDRVDPLDYLKILRRRWWVWVTVVALALVAAFLSLPRSGENTNRGPLATSYSATHTLLQAPDVQSAVDLELTRLFATTGEIPRIAAQTLGRPADDGPVLAAGVSVAVDPEVSALRITSIGTDGPLTARTANAFGEAVKTFLRTEADEDRAAEVSTLQGRTSSLEQRIVDLQRQLAAAPPQAPVLQAQQDALASQYQAAFERLEVLQSQSAASSPLATLEEAVPIVAVATGSPVPTSRSGRLLLALVVGLVLGVGLALGVDRLDTRMRTRAEVEQATGLAVVAEIPPLPKRQRTTPEIATVASPGSGVAEAYRGLRAALLLIPSRTAVPAGADPPPVDLTTWRPPQVVLVTSPAPADGKTSTVVNLAAAMAESGRTVVVLDADFRNPQANRFLGVPRSPGLSDLLDGSVAGGLPAVLQRTTVDGVRMVTSGTSGRTPGAMLAQLSDVVRAARELADIVLIDVAPMLAANDATDILPHVDSVIVVTQAGRTSAPAAERTVDLLARLAAPVLGVVVQAADEADGLGTYDGYGKPQQHAAEGAAGHDGPTDVPAATTPARRGRAMTTKPKTTRSSHARP